MRKFYLTFQKSETVSHQLTWSHYFELLKCDNTLELQFYFRECIKEGWKVRELKRQMKSCLFQRLALSTDKAWRTASTTWQIVGRSEIASAYTYTDNPKIRCYTFNWTFAYQDPSETQRNLSIQKMANKKGTYKKQLKRWGPQENYDFGRRKLNLRAPKAMDFRRVNLLNAFLLKIASLRTPKFGGFKK